VVTPVKERGRLLFSALQDVESWAPLEMEDGPAWLSLKEFFVPRSECLLQYSLKEGGKAEMAPPEPDAWEPQLVIGCRACDAAALEVLDKVMNWDPKDPVYLKRREKTVMMTLQCSLPSEGCWCEALGSGPAAAKGSDIMMARTGDDFIVEALTPKGEALIKEHAGLFEEGGDAPVGTDKPESKAARLDAEKIRGWLEKNFEHPLWEDPGFRCLGCGTCAFVCPVCHCFDIVDEGNQKGGKRLKNWDSCAFAQFTVHGSGHNPRDTQAKRWRQRVQHKFNIYPGKFGVISCVGCGRCDNACPVGNSLLDMLKKIQLEN
jgi:formate hydrogenlyase subunit 6/NADH:ubiquinone oxidoreductase subunit I